ncbi:PAS domain S-box protein [Halomicrobium salinisoli]|uniref:sensor histidine kinase n=1 Tax=Halomicrobium salinisoli TaxID=2878391 RepID=UPI001CEFF365|nr:PAS domain S-box protein [Halomicrobium salinisoli]
MSRTVVAHVGPPDGPSLDGEFDVIRAGAGEVRSLIDGADCVVVEADLPEAEWVEALRTVSEARPDLPVLLCTDEPDGTAAARATRNGATEYVPRSTTDPAERVRAVVDGDGTEPGGTGDESGAAGAGDEAEEADAEANEADDPLSGLLETTRALMLAHRPPQVADIVAGAAEDVLGFERNLVRLYDPETGALEPVARTDAVADETPDRTAYAVGEGPPGEAFQTGETLVVDDHEGRPDGHDRGSHRSSAYVPLGEHGVLCIGSERAGAFDETDVSMAEILAANAADALDRVERERELRRYRAVVEHGRDMMFVLDGDCEFDLVTGPLADRVGYDRPALRSRSPRSLIADDDAVDGIYDAIERLREGEAADVAVETDLLTAGGDRFPVEIDLSLLPEDGGRPGVVGVVRDRTDLRRARERLRDERDRFSYLFDSLPDPVVETEFVGGRPRVRSVNPAFEDVFGYDAAAIRDRNLNDLILPPDEDVRATARALDHRAEQGQIVHAEVRRRTADGYRDFLFRGVPYDRGDGGRWGFGIYTDISDQRERERRIQVLNRVLRHNLRNDMTVVLGVADYLREALDGELADRVGLLERTAESLVRMSERAREVERAVRSGDRNPVDVAAVVEDVTTEFAASSAADVRTDVAGTALAGDERLRTALRELLENAVRHNETPAVEVGVRVDDRTVEVSVADDGAGIPDRELAVVVGDAEITQLTHSRGLGLWLVKWTTGSMGGTVEFARDGGTTVTLTLPRADAE